MAITWRVPVLVLLGIGPVVLRPEAGTVWLWLLLVVVLVTLDVVLAPRRPPSPSYDARCSALVRATPRPPPSRSRPAAAGWAGCCATPGSPPRGRPTTGTASTWPRERASSSPAGCDRSGGVTWRADRVTVRTTGPLGLAGRQGGLEVPGSVRVLPAFPSIRHLPSRLARLQELDGRAAVRVRGQGTEFDSLREYVLGDDVRSVDWRASARTRSVVVRTWQPERDRRVVLVLDTGRTSAGRVDDAPRLDSAMDAALLLATWPRARATASPSWPVTSVSGAGSREPIGGTRSVTSRTRWPTSSRSWRRRTGPA